MPAEHEHPEREQRVVDLINRVSAQTAAPHALRMQVDALSATGARRVGPFTRLRARVAGVGASAALVVALAVAFLGGSAAPSLAQVTALAGRGPAGPAPGPDSSRPSALLSTQVGQLHFPNWDRVGGWVASGQRTDTVGGRNVKTVYYTHDGRRLAYSIVASPVVPGSRASGSPYVWMAHGSRESVVWVEDGHTCVLSGTGISADALWALAATTIR